MYQDPNENWHRPDYNYARCLSISTPPSWRDVLLLNSIPLGFQKDSEHIWSGNWPPDGGRGLSGADSVISRPFWGRPAESLLARFDCSQFACQEISLILISSVTQVDQAVLSKTQIMAEMQSCRC